MTALCFFVLRIVPVPVASFPHGGSSISPWTSPRTNGLLGLVDGGAGNAPGSTIHASLTKPPASPLGASLRRWVLCPLSDFGLDIVGSCLRVRARDAVTCWQVLPCAPSVGPRLRERLERTMQRVLLEANRSAVDAWQESSE